MAELLVTADAALVEATFSSAVPGEFAPLIGLAVGRAGVRVIADCAVAGVVAEVVHQIGQVGLRVSQEFNCLWTTFDFGREWNNNSDPLSTFHPLLNMMSLMPCISVMQSSSL